jgi:hypothetical protein
MIEYIDKFGIQSVTDDVKIYEDAGIIMYATNDWLAYSPFFPADNSCDTDIQCDLECFVF